MNLPDGFNPVEEIEELKAMLEEKQRIWELAMRCPKCGELTNNGFRDVDCDCGENHFWDRFKRFDNGDE